MDMKTNSNSQNLNLAISHLENRKHEEWMEIKDQINKLQDNLKPLTIVKTVIDEFKDALGAKNNILKTLFSFGVGYLSSKVVVGKTQSKFKNFLGSLLMLSVSKFVNKSSKMIQ